jgi:cyclopropane fatty-acyl-phospholipid synthase-like methyltransferase
MGNVWQDFFDYHAPRYLENSFTKDTLAEVDFLVEELNLPPGSSILDVGCGTGRHAVELARHGYRMTGIDISDGMLEQGVRAATEAGVEVEWVHADVARYTPAHTFQAAICLCEGAFGLLGMGEEPLAHDLALLQMVHSALVPGAPFILNALNGLKKIRSLTQEDVDFGRFDPNTLVETMTVTVEDPRGHREVHVREKGYLPSELAMLLERAGFELLYLWGGTAGNWGHRPIQLDEYELMAVARRI